MIENFKNIIDNSDELFTIFFSTLDENGIYKEYSREFTNWITFDTIVAFNFFCIEWFLYCDLFTLIFIFGYYFKRVEDKEVLFYIIMLSGYITCFWTLFCLILNLFSITYTNAAVIETVMELIKCYISPFFPTYSNWLLDWIFSLFLVSELGFFYQLNLELFKGYYINCYTQVIKIIIISFSLIFYRLFLVSFSNKKNYPWELPILLSVSTILLVHLVSFNNLALFLLALEGFSLILYIFTIIERSFGGVLAGVKYFTFGTLGSISLLWGLAHIYSLIPSLSYDHIFIIFNLVNSDLSTEGIELTKSFNFAFILITIGFLIKLGAAPFHQWVIDVYSGVPMVITAYYSIVVKFVLFIFFIRIAYNISVNDIISISIAASLVIGCYLSLRQQEIKRLLAASSIVHVAFLLMGDVTSSLIYILVYLLSNLLIFLLLILLRLNTNEFLHLNDLKHMRKTSLYNAITFSIACISMAGLPPFAGFFGKFAVWISLMEDIYLTNNKNTYFILFISILISLLTIFYYFRLISYIFIGSDNNNNNFITTTINSANSISSNVVSYFDVDYDSSEEFFINKDINQYVLAYFITFFYFFFTPLFSFIMLLHDGVIYNYSYFF